MKMNGIHWPVIFESYRRVLVSSATSIQGPDMNLLSLARGLLAATLLASLVACGGGASDPGPSAEALAANPVAEAGRTGGEPTPSLRCAP
jgi:hypothetical protein